MCLSRKLLGNSGEPDELYGVRISGNLHQLRRHLHRCTPYRQKEQQGSGADQIVPRHEEDHGTSAPSAGPAERDVRRGRGGVPAVLRRPHVESLPRDGRLVRQ